VDATRGHGNAPGGFCQHPYFFPCRCLPLLMINRQDIIPFPCKNDVAQSSPMPSHAERLRDLSRVQGSRTLSAIHPLTMQRSFALGQPDKESIGFLRLITTLLRTTP
jgi:hypothetical protein